MPHDAYITSEYYTETYKGAVIPAASFDRIALRASEEIDALTMDKIRAAGGIDTFSEGQTEKIQLATCVIAEWLSREDEASSGSGIVPSSEKVGSYSYTTDSAELTRARSAAYTRAESFLVWTGLLYRGVGRQ